MTCKRDDTRRCLIPGAKWRSSCEAPSIGDLSLDTLRSYEAKIAAAEAVISEGGAAFLFGWAADYSLADVREEIETRCLPAEDE